MNDVKYDMGYIPPDYKCSNCGASGVKLWRQYNSFNVSLLCCDCAEKNQNKKLEKDCIGWLLPAIPDEEGLGYWGYSAVPKNGIDWWKSLIERAMSITAEK